MPRKPKHRDFFEPWKPLKTRLVGPAPFADGIPPEVDSEAAERIRAAHEKAVENADVVIWGSRMVEPAIATDIGGQKSIVMDDRHIITVVRRQTTPEGSVTHDQVADRLCDCVNACRNIPEPGHVIEGLKKLLFDMLRGDADRCDGRVLSLYAQMFSEPQELFNEE
jgi:hypothetical protein